MKFLADENLGILVPKFLREKGFDVVSIFEKARGADDRKVLQLANKERRILITLDKDFGELIFKEKLIHTGVILLRLKDESVENKMMVLEKILKSRKSYSGKFTVIRK